MAMPLGGASSRAIDLRHAPYGQLAQPQCSTLSTHGESHSPRLSQHHESEAHTLTSVAETLQPGVACSVQQLPTLFVVADPVLVVATSLDVTGGAAVITSSSSGREHQCHRPTAHAVPGLCGGWAVSTRRREIS